MVIKLSTWKIPMSELVKRRLKRKKRSGGEANCNCKLHEIQGWKGYYKSVHSYILLSSKETKMVARIILLGMEIVVIYGNNLYVESCKKKTPKSMSQIKFS